MNCKIVKAAFAGVLTVILAVALSGCNIEPDNLESRWTYTLTPENIGDAGNPAYVKFYAAAGGISASFTTATTYQTVNRTLGNPVTKIDENTAGKYLYAVEFTAEGSGTVKKCGVSADPLTGIEASDKNYFVKLSAVLLPTANIAFLWQPDGLAGGDDQAASAPGAVTIGLINSGVSSVIITLTNTAAQSLVKGGADANYVTISGSNGTANRALTVDTSGIADKGGNKEFTITVSESGKASVKYTVTVGVALPPSSDTKTFWAQKAYYQKGDSPWYQVTAEKAGESVHCIVYGDTTLKADSPAEGKYTVSQAQKLADVYEEHVYNQIKDAFGDIEDMDGNGKVIFLLLDIVDGGSVSGGYIAGYFDSTHMYSRNTYTCSNETDMLFIDVNPGTTENCRSTMAHELQHLINFSETVSKGRSQKDTWIDEGLSTGAEYIYGLSIYGDEDEDDEDDEEEEEDDWEGEEEYNRNVRLDLKDYDPNDRIYIYNYYWNSNTSYYTNERVDSFFHWDNTLMDYSTDYLFFQWLRIHASIDTGIYREIIAGNNGDYRDVTAAASAWIDTRFADWSRLLSTWLVANGAQQTSGYYGYRTSSRFLNCMAFTSSGSFPLYPGEGILSVLSGTKTMTDSGNIKYLAFNEDTGTVDEDGNYDRSATPYVLTYNVNTDTKGARTAGQLAGSVEGGGGLSLSRAGQPLFSVIGKEIPAPALPALYPIGFDDMRRLRGLETAAGSAK